jgi:hypothetical protein
VRLTRPQRVAIGAAVVALVASVAALAVAGPLASWGTHRVLERLEGYRATFESAEIRIADLAYVVRGLRLETKAQDATVERMELRSVAIDVDGRALLGGEVVVRVELDSPVVRIVQREAGGTLRRVRAIGMPSSVPDVLVERMEVRGGEILWTDVSTQERPTLRLHAVEGELQAFPTRADGAPGGSTTLAVNARLQDSGDVAASAEAAPAADRLTFSGKARILGLKLEDLEQLIEARSDFQPEGGAYHATVEVRADGGELTGEVRAVVESPNVSAEGDGIGAAAQGLAADAALALLAEPVEGVDDPALVATIPIRGTLAERARPIPTFLAVVASSFARGLSAGLSVPPGTDTPTRVRGPRADHGSR